MEKWIPTRTQLPCEGVPVLIWDGGCHVAKIRRGISEETRAAMKRGEIDDPVAEYWSASSGTVLLKRSDMYTSADVHGNNLVPYCWDEAAGGHSWRGQDIKFWMPLPPKPEGRDMENIIIEKTGAVYYYYGYETSFRVDSFNLLGELSQKLEDSRPSTDYDGRFAGRVKIEIEFLGEQLEESEDA